MTGGALTTPRFLQAGDTALTVELGATAELGLSLRVLELYAQISSAGLPGVVELVPTLRSLTVHYDPRVTSSRVLRAALAPIVDVGLAESGRDVSTDGNAVPVPGRRWLMPACYAPEFGPDIESVAAACGLDAGQVPALHASVPYRVLMVGFLPGHPYMGNLPPPLRIPRRDTPRTSVPAGSVAIATTMSVIYPLESPGGWHIIARTPVALFDATRAEPSLLAPGDEVRFRPIGRDEFDALSAAVAAGTWAIEPVGAAP